jgi:hypothetical protein
LIGGSNTLKKGESENVTCGLGTFVGPAVTKSLGIELTMSLGTVDTVSLGTVDTVSLGTVDTMSLGTVDTMSLGTVDTMSLGTVDTVSLGTIDTMSLGTIDTPPDAKSLGTVEGTNDELCVIAGDPATIDTGCGGATNSLLLLLLLFLSETYIDKPTTADINSIAITIRPMGSRSAITRAVGWFVRFF